MKRQFAKNWSSNWAVYIVSALITFFLTPYIIDKLGQSAYGVWILVGSFSGYLGLFDFGIGYAVVRFVARYQQTGEVEKRNEVVATSFYTAFALSILVIIATFYIMYNAASFFDIPADIAADSKMVILLVGISIAIAFPLSIFSEALAGGLWRFDLFNKVSLVIALFKAGLSIFFLEIGWGLAGLGLGILIGSVVGYLWRMRMLYKLLPDLSISPKYLKKPVLKKISSYSFYSFILVLSGRLAFYSDSFVVGIYRGIEDVAIFGIAVKLTEYLRQFVFTLTRLFSPVASKYDPDMDKASLKRIFYDGSRLNLLFSLPLSVLLYFWGGRFIEIWIGPDFAYSTIILQVLLIGHLVSFMQGIGGEMLLGVGRHRFFAIVSAISAVLNVLLSIILVNKIGLVGVAWGTTIPLVLVSIFYLPFSATKLVGGNIFEFIRKSILPPVISVLPVGIAVYFIRDLISNFTDFFLWSVIIVLLYSLTAYLFGINSGEKEKIKELLSRYKK